MLRRPLASMLLALFLGLASIVIGQEESAPPQEPTPAPAPLTTEPHRCPCVPIYSVALRAGGWWMGSFDAQTPSGRRQITASLFFDAGVDFEVERFRWTLALSGDYGVAQDVHAAAASIRVGRRFPLGGEISPLDLRVSAGPAFGSLDTDASGFGAFKAAVGFEARADLNARLQDHVSLDFWASYRQLTFKYDETVTSGDTRAGGPGVAVGIGLVMRF